MFILSFLAGVCSLVMISLFALGWASFIVSTYFFWKTEDLFWKKHALAGAFNQPLALSMLPHLIPLQNLGLWQIRIGTVWTATSMVLFLLIPFLLRKRIDLVEMVKRYYIRLLWETNLIIAILLIGINQINYFSV